MTHEEQLALNRSMVVRPERPGPAILGEFSVYAVHNRYLRVALACTALIIVMFSIAGWRLAQAWADRKPLVVRINQDGDAMMAPYATLDYKPREPEIRYFLNRFVIEHYGRVRATAKDAFARKLFFFSGELARTKMQEEHESVQNFIANYAMEEIDIFPNNVTIQDLRQPPYKASVTFDKVYHLPNDTRETKRERYVANMQFTLLEKVPNNFVQVNPLGLVITYLRQDQAFDQPSPTPQSSARMGF